WRVSGGVWRWREVSAAAAFEDGAQGQQQHHGDDLAADHDAVDVHGRLPPHVALLDDEHPGRGGGHAVAEAAAAARLALLVLALPGAAAPAVRDLPAREDGHVARRQRFAE